MAKKKLAKTARTTVAPRRASKPIIDADRPLVIKIERGDIRGAQAMSPGKCGAARALIRQEHALAAHVYRSRTLVEYADRIVRYVTPKRLRDETISFDRGTDRFLEGDYKLLRPTGNDKLGADHRASTRGGGADKRGAPRQDPMGTRPRSPATSHL